MFRMRVAFKYGKVTSRKTHLYKCRISNFLVVHATGPA